MPKKSANIRTPANGRKEPKVSRVRWSPEEQALLIDTAATAMKNKEVFSLREALEKAQEQMPKDQSPDTLKSMLKNADHAVGMVGFLSHSHDGILKSSKIPYHPVSGGVSQVKRTLEELL